MLCPAHSRGRLEERERARKGIHVIKGLPYKISTRQGWVLRNWYFKPYKWWEWRPQFKVFITDTSEYTWCHKGSGFCVCVFTQWHIPSCFDLGRIKRLKTNEEMLIWKINLLWRMIKLPWWDFKPMGLKNIWDDKIWEYLSLNSTRIWRKVNIFTLTNNINEKRWFYWKLFSVHYNFQL